MGNEGILLCHVGTFTKVKDLSPSSTTAPASWIIPHKIVAVLGEGRDPVPLCLGFKFAV